MNRLLLRLYPPAWRARYGDEFLAILEARPVGPFDVADIVLGAVDARIRARQRGRGGPARGGYPMSLRIGGIAAMLGAPTWTVGFVLLNESVGPVWPRIAAALMVLGSAALLVALVGLSAFQARTHRWLAWAACVVPAIGTMAVLVGSASLAATATVSDIFFFGLVAFLPGSILFAVATFWTDASARPAAALLGLAPVFAFIGGSGGGIRDVVIVTGLAVYALAWILLGAAAVRRDRPLLGAGPA